MQGHLVEHEDESEAAYGARKAVPAHVAAVPQPTVRDEKPGDRIGGASGKGKKRGRRTDTVTVTDADTDTGTDGRTILLIRGPSLILLWRFFRAAATFAATDISAAGRSYR